MASQDSESFYKSLFDNTLDGLAYCQMVFDAGGEPVDFIYLKVNKIFGSLTGLKDVEGKKVTDVIPGIRTSNPELFAIYSRVALGGKPEKFETNIKSLAKWFLVSVYCPKRNYFVAVFQNITDRKETEKNLANASIAAQNVLEDLSIEKTKLQLAETKEAAILQSIGDGVIVTDEKGKITLLNKMAEQLFSLKSEEVLGKNFPSVVVMEDEAGLALPPDKLPMSLALAGTITSTSGTASGYYYVQRDKIKFPVAVTVTPVVLDGKVIGTINVFRDITQEKEVDQAKTEFVSLASHQLRAPLTAISWYTEILLKNDLGQINQKQRKYLNQVYRGNRRMIELVNALLDVSRLEMGTFVNEPEPTDVVRIATEVVKEAESEILKRQQKLESKFDNGVPKINIDPRLIRMVFQNLLSNAVKYSPPESRIVFSITKPKENLLVTVKDDGYGIPKRQQDQIFTKLFRADNTKGKETEGTGLGLYIVKSIVDRSKGEIWFESAENKGTTFYVQLPIGETKGNSKLDKLSRQ